MALLHGSPVLSAKAARAGLAGRSIASTISLTTKLGMCTPARRGETATVFARDAQVTLIPAPGADTITKEALPSPENTGDLRAMIA
ncbi:MAG: hypothetical protein GX885_08350 [Methanomicrobiales archaeon]|nr:hypothetical protein [Methanomicrobiales archaeon]